MPIGTYTPDTVVQGNVPSQVPNENADPGSVNAPAVAEPSSALTGGKPVLLIAASGASAAYGGCEVHVSFDGTNYSLIGTIETSAPQGVLTSNLADHVDPDTVNTLAVDCTESFAAPSAGITNSDADNDRTLSLVCVQPSAGVLSNSGELLAFGAVAATGTWTANLAYLRRGQLGSAHAAHSTGDMFTVLDVLGESGTCLRYDLPPQYIATTIYLKLAAFNQFGNATQDLSLVTEYQFTPVGRGYGGGTNGVPTIPTGLAANAGVQQVQLSWSANLATDNVTAYEVWRAAGTGASFGSASLIATVGGLAYLDTGLGVATGYTYFLEAVNAVGASSPTSGVNATTSATALGTVTSVGTGTGLTGGPITSTGTISLAAIANNDVLANTSGGSAAPVPTTVSTLIDAALGSTRGAILERGASGWTLIAPGTSGYVLTSNGSAADPSYQAASSGSGTVTSVAMTGDGTVFNSSVSGSPITTSGTLAPSLHTQSASTALMGPASGGAAAPTFRQPADADLSVTDITTNNVSTSAHGFAPKSPNNAALFLDGTGAYSKPTSVATGGSSASFVIPSSAAASSSDAAFGNIITPLVNMTISAVGIVMTTVSGGTYKLGIAAFNTSTKQITSVPNYISGTVSDFSPATNRELFGKLASPLSLTAGSTYLLILVRTDSTTTVSQTVTWNNLTTSNAFIGAGFQTNPSNTGAAWVLASTNPQTTDTWGSAGGGNWSFDGIYSIN